MSGGRDRTLCLVTVIGHEFGGAMAPWSPSESATDSNQLIHGRYHAQAKLRVHVSVRLIHIISKPWYLAAFYNYLIHSSTHTTKNRH